MYSSFIQRCAFSSRPVLVPTFRTSFAKGMYGHHVTSSMSYASAVAEGGPSPSPTHPPTASTAITPPSSLSSLGGIRNARDLHEALPAIAPGRVIRCAKPSGATSDDVKFLYNNIGIKDMIDLRAQEELAEDGPSCELFRRVTFRSFKRNWRGQLLPDMVLRDDFDGVVHNQVSLLDKVRYVTSLIRRLPRRQVAKVATLVFLSWEDARKLVIENINGGGLTLLYEILLESAQPEFVTALTIITTSAEKGRPVMFFCKAGKDRTGLLAALVLSVMGATEEEIVADYIRSDAFRLVALAGMEQARQARGLDLSVFECAPASVMEGLLKLVRTRYGSLTAYMSFIGFGADMQRRMRFALSADPGRGTGHSQR